MQVTDADMQDPELLAEMRAMMGDDAPSPQPAPKPPTPQQLTAQIKQCRQQAIAMKNQGNLAEARALVRATNVHWKRHLLEGPTRETVTQN